MIEHKHKLPKLLDDPYLSPFRDTILGRKRRTEDIESKLTNGGEISLEEFSSAHEYYGFHRTENEWIFREWAPSAKTIYLIGDFNDWTETEEFSLKRINKKGDWEIKLPLETLHHKDQYKLRMHWDGGADDRIPAYARRVVQDKNSLIFSAQIWQPEETYTWEIKDFKHDFTTPLIYEAHVGMGQEKCGVGTYNEFREKILPRVIDAGYNTLQLMAVMEHPYYGSFGYHVANFFASSSRFGTPEELKLLIDEAHKNGLAVIIDLVHSHAVNNEVEGLSRFDGTLHQYFHAGGRGHHSAWESRCFDYAKPEVLHFLLSNCRYWLDEFNIDGFRFDGITSMMYYDHGLGTAYTSYDLYFDNSVDEESLTYLALANKVIHSINPDAITIAEDVSGMPGLAAPFNDGGIGFDYKLSLGIPDLITDLVSKISDDDWDMDEIFRELTNHRGDERTISYVECHDQSIVGSKTTIFWLADANMYWHMNVESQDLTIERAIALHKMLRLITLSTANGGYLNFMGNEFGHPEWVDFPREGNNWSYKYARRQWSLRDSNELKYKFLGEFDKSIMHLISEFNSIEEYCELRYSHCNDNILALSRGDLTFIYNFHPTKSVSEYLLDLPGGEYMHVLNSDEDRFGGQNRIDSNQVFTTHSIYGRTGIQLYLPCRTSIIIKKIK